MKDRYEVKSERYGHTHSFVKTDGDDAYIFVCEKEWMPIRVCNNADGAIEFIDPEGGPCIGVGFKTDEVEVTAITRDEKHYEIFTLKELDKEN